MQCTNEGLAVLDVQKRLALYGYNTRACHKPLRSALEQTLRDYSIWLIALGAVTLMVVQWLTVCHGLVWLLATIYGTALSK